jgi:L-amino acid N-acyltransferase
MNIRTATHADLEIIQEIFNDAILHSTAVYEYEIFTMDYIKKWYEDKIAHAFPVLVLELENRVAGFCTYGTFRQRAAYRTTMEHSVYVHPEFRNQGLGKVLLKTIMESAATNGVHALIGGIDSSNEQSIVLHEKFGFKEVGRLPEVAFKFGKWLDLVFMEIILTSQH